MWPWITSQTGRTSVLPLLRLFLAPGAADVGLYDPWTPSNKGYQRGEGQRVPTKVVTERRGQLVQFICKQEVATLQARPNRSSSEGSGGGKHLGSGAVRCPMRREFGRVWGASADMCVGFPAACNNVRVPFVYERERERERCKNTRSRKERMREGWRMECMCWETCGSMLTACD